MWPVSWHWKHLLLSLDMVLTDEGVAQWMLIAVQPEVFQLPLWCLLGFVVPFHIHLVASICAFFRPLRNILMVVVSLLNLHLLASHLKW